ncbi:Proton-dependent oligopeptide transporter family [Corchorus olitorius]|uniref:Proton-dependent oligopeptide transporter family n=1 Tax=Corchorus olitorius TaxID=93759 RepID=A0A1R3JV33_9ROSI|nr:Proton-dependent oligopeptide transporter family [Corchorus olitorius]
MFVSFLCCITARQVEIRRLQLSKVPESYNEDGEIPMSMFWLTPQFVLLGLTEGLVEEGLEEIFYDHVPESMKRYQLPFNQCVLGIDQFLSIIFILVFFRGWFGDSAYTSHFDKYFLTLAIMSLGACAFFSLAMCAIDWKIKIAQERVQEDLVEMGVPLTNLENQVTTSTPQSSTQPIVTGTNSSYHLPAKTASNWTIVKISLPNLRLRSKSGRQLN